MAGRSESTDGLLWHQADSRVVVVTPHIDKSVRDEPPESFQEASLMEAREQNDLIHGDPAVIVMVGTGTDCVQHELHVGFQPLLVI